MAVTKLSLLYDQFCKALAVVYSILWLLLTPFIFFSLIPVFIFRYLVSRFAKCFRPDLAKILSISNASIAATDKFTGDSPQNTTVIAIKIKGIPDLEECREIVTEKLLEVKLSDNSGELRNPELKQYPVKFMGYYFWKPEEKFDIKEHIYFYAKQKENEISLDGSVTTYSEEDAAKVEAELVAKPHKIGKSPWEFVILSPVHSEGDDNKDGEYSYIFYRNHHLVTDGFGILNLMMDLCGVDLLRKPPPQPKINKFQKMFYFLMKIIRSPYDVFIVPLQTLPRIENKFRLPNKELGKKHVGSKPLCIPLEKLRAIRKRENVSVTAIQYSLWVGGLRRTMILNNLKIPDYIHCTSPQSLPFPHPEKLRIFAGFWVMLLPVGAVEDPVKRLKAIEKKVKNLKNSATTLASFFFLKPLFGHFPAFIQNVVYPKATGTVCLNCFPGPPEYLSVFNREVDQIHFTYGQTKSLYSSLFSSISYCGNIYMKTTLNEKIKITDVEQFQNCMLEELEALSKETV